MEYNIVMCFSYLQMRFGLVIRFIDHLQVSITVLLIFTTNHATLIFPVVTTISSYTLKIAVNYYTPNNVFNVC
jgi:multisubunit Na+/H+ antiporter MnhB subunit